MTPRTPPRRLRTALVCLGTGLALLTSRTAQATPADYHLELHVPPKHVVTCDDPDWFHSWFQFARSPRYLRRLQPTLNVDIMANGLGGFDLSLVINDATGKVLHSTLQSYPSSTECAEIVAEAAGIANQLLATEQPTALLSGDYEVELDAAVPLEDCDDPQQFRRFFELARRAFRFRPLLPKKLGLSLEGNLDDAVHVKAAIRSPDGRLIAGERYLYAGPTECAKVLGYTARNLAILAMTTPDVSGSFLPSLAAPQPSLLRVGAGATGITGITPYLSSGFFLTLGARWLPNFDVSATFTRLQPSSWRSSTGRTVVDMTSLRALSLSGCRRFEMLGLCAQAYLWEVKAIARTVRYPHEGTGYPLSLGAKMFFEPPLNAPFSLQFYVEGSLQLQRVSFRIDKRDYWVTPVQGANAGVLFTMPLAYH